MAQFILDKWTTDKAGCLIAGEAGTGKTRPVLEVMVKLMPRKALIVVPAIARQEWIRQAALWVPHLHLFAAKTGKMVNDWCANPEGILVTSYQLLKHVIGGFDFVCLDEVHMISNPDAGMTKEVGRIVNSNESTFLAALSGTPAMDRPDQLWSVLNLVQPGSWGSNIWSFRRRYCEAIPNEWAPSGVVYRGLHPDRAVELGGRLLPIMYRVRKSDIGDLPPLLMSMRYIKPKRSKLDWDNEENFTALLNLNSSAKLDAVVDVILQAKDSGESKFVVFTYLRQTAVELGARLDAIGLQVEVVTGALAADARHDPIERIRTAQHHPAVLVCNIDAVGVSLDFTFAQTAVFAEQHWVPGKTSQALGRLVRLSSTRHCNCIFVVVEGSKEQRQAEAFCRKQGDLDKIIAGGRDELMAQSVLGQVESDENVLRGLM